MPNPLQESESDDPNTPPPRSNGLISSTYDTNTRRTTDVGCKDIDYGPFCHEGLSLAISRRFLLAFLTLVVKLLEYLRMRVEGQGSNILGFRSDYRTRKLSFPLKLLFRQ